MSPCQSFSEVVMTATKDKDYRLVIRDRSSATTVVAVHGGNIDPLTSELAESIAGDTYNLYVFCGLRADSDGLHVPTRSFQEMRLSGLMRRSRVALSIEGVAGGDAIVHIGGRNRRLRTVLGDLLGFAGFQVAGPAKPGAAHNPRWFFNTPAEGGLQLELSRTLCQGMLDCPLDAPERTDPAHWTQRFESFVQAVRRALEQYRAEVDSDLQLTLERFERATDAFPPSLRSSYHHHGDK